MARVHEIGRLPFCLNKCGDCGRDLTYFDGQLFHYFPPPTFVFGVKCKLQDNYVTYQAVHEQGLVFMAGELD